MGDATVHVRRGVLRGSQDASSGSSLSPTHARSAGLAHAHAHGHNAEHSPRASSRKCSVTCLRMRVACVMMLLVCCVIAIALSVYRTSVSLDDIARVYSPSSVISQVLQDGAPAAPEDGTEAAADLNNMAEVDKLLEAIEVESENATAAGLIDAELEAAAAQSEQEGEAVAGDASDDDTDSIGEPGHVHATSGGPSAVPSTTPAVPMGEAMHPPQPDMHVQQASPATGGPKDGAATEQAAAAVQINAEQQPAAPPKLEPTVPQNEPHNTELVPPEEAVDVVTPMSARNGDAQATKASTERQERVETSHKSTSNALADHKASLDNDADAKAPLPFAPAATNIAAAEHHEAPPGAVALRKTIKGIKSLIDRPGVSIDHLLEVNHAYAYWKRKPDRRTTDQRVAAVHRTCFNPDAHVDAAGLPLPMNWRLYRISRRIIPGDPDYLVYQNVYYSSACAPTRMSAQQVVIATHMTYERQPVLLELARRWQGCISLAVLACDWGHVQSLVASIADEPILRKFVILHIVIGENGLYPFNVMRNVALEPWQRAFEEQSSWPIDVRTPTLVMQSRVPAPWPRHRSSCTRPRPPDGRNIARMRVALLPWLFTIDIDALPSADAATFSWVVTTLMQARMPTSTVIAVASFELKSEALAQLKNRPDALLVDTSSTPSPLALFKSLHSLVSSKKIRVFHVDRTTRAYLGRMPVGAWFRNPPSSSGKTQHTGFNVDYSMYFEPYFIAKPPFPRFDEFFRGRGMSKSSWFFSHVATGEYRIVLMPGLFLYCRNDFDNHHRADVTNLPKVSRDDNKQYMARVIVDAVANGDVCHSIIERERDLQAVQSHINKRRRG